jgi:formate hydrogenlyase subunit 3/multisubunit Na+/H+ antiporter MnhD subunit
MTQLYYIIFLPVMAGILLFFLPDRFRTIKGILALAVSGISLFFAAQLYAQPIGVVQLDMFSSWFREGSLLHQVLQGANKYSTYNVDSLSRLITVCVCVFTLLITLYSLAYMNKNKVLQNYYAFVLLTLGLTAGAALTDNLLLLLGYWGMLGLTLYKLIHGYDEESSAAAKKTLILIGASDGIMILGIAILWRIYKTLSMSELNVPTTYPILSIAFISLLVGSFTKAGAFPLHTWIPDYAKYAPASSSAYLPASLDKLLGIYFMARLCVDIFKLNEWLRFTMLLLGVMTIIFAVMMALIQHNYKRLLGYHAVSQVGYMVVGLALGTPLGIAGGLFHMINHATYKAGLFLSAGSVEHATHKDELDDLGGLSKAMPLTFISALICALSISGVPPLNGFASKWLIYQGIIDFGRQPGFAHQLWFIWLGLAVLGSALTLASFVKYISGIFLGNKKEEFKEVKEVSFLMWLPNVLLALVCLVFGVFASSWIIPRLIMPLYGSFEYTGIWQSTSVSILVLVSLLLGFLMYWIGNLKKFRIDESFIGGETGRLESSYPVVEFYKTIQDFKLLNVIYKQAEKKWYDIYDICRRITFWAGGLLGKAHTGVLTAYSIWLFAGLVLLLIILMQL